MTAMQRIERRMKKAHSLLCVGLDPDLQSMPKKFHSSKTPLFDFNVMVISATHHYVCAYKLNSAFYEAFGAHGIQQLHDTCAFLHKKHPDIPIILDAKRGDIDSTNAGSVKFAFEYLGVDAITLNPYLGKQALQPFLERKDKACIVLCRTSNPGAGEFQDVHGVRNESLYLRVARNVAKRWNTNKNCMLVVGATYPSELEKVRNIVGDMMILVPGVGAQGGNLQRILHAGLNAKKNGLIMTISRAIIYVGDQKHIENATQQYYAHIEELRHAKKQ